MEERGKQGIGTAGIVTLIAVLGYLAFELYAVRSARDRMEPAHVYAQFAMARQAVSRCEADSPYASDFERNFQAVTRLATRDLAEQQPDLSPAQLDDALAARRQIHERDVDVLIAEQGCAGGDVWRLRKLYEVRSRLNLR
jgi:hypothetical protein